MLNNNYFNHISSSHNHNKPGINTDGGENQQQVESMEYQEDIENQAFLVANVAIVKQFLKLKP